MVERIEEQKVSPPDVLDRDYTTIGIDAGTTNYAVTCITLQNNSP